MSARASVYVGVRASVSCAGPVREARAKTRRIDTLQQCRGWRENSRGSPRVQIVQWSMPGRMRGDDEDDFLSRGT